MLRTLVRNESGAAAVEFGLIFPIVAAILLGVADGANTLLKYNKMRSAVSSGAQYVMAGGTDLTVARSVAIGAWRSAPANADIQVSKACYCGVTANVCTTLCADGTVPVAYVSFSSSATLTGLTGSRALNSTQVVRVR